MKKVIFRGFFDGHTGYVEASVRYPLAIKQAGFECEISPIVPLSKDHPLKDMVMKNKDNSFSILHQTPDFQADLAYQHDGYFTVSEADFPQTTWWIKLNWAKLVLTQSTFSKKSLAKIPGIDGNKIHIVNFILDPMFKPEGETSKLIDLERGELTKGESFIFGSVFEWVIRKKPQLMWQAFMEEFPLKEYPNVLFINRISAPTQYSNVKYDFNKYTNNDPRIKRIENMIKDIPAFYRSLDCYCSPTAGEGWGATLCEAMACGIPTIGSKNTGNLDFMDDSNSYLVDCGELEYVGDEAFVKNSYNFPYQRWRLPKVSSIRKCMRTIYDLKMSGKPNLRAQEGIKVKDKYTMANAAAQFKEALEGYL